MTKKSKPSIVSVTLHDKGIGCYRVTFNRKITTPKGVEITKGRGYYFAGMTDELATYNMALELIKEGGIK